MTIELTHVQAGLLRALIESRGDQGDFYELDHCLTSMLPSGVLHYDGRDSFESAKLTTGEFNEP